MAIKSILSSFQVGNQVHSGDRTSERTNEFDFGNFAEIFDRNNRTRLLRETEHEEERKRVSKPSYSD